MPIRGLSNQWQTKERSVNDFVFGAPPEIEVRLQQLFTVLDARAEMTIYIGTSLSTMNFSQASLSIGLRPSD